MKKALYAKFTQDQTLKTLLLETGENEIIEASPRDSYWGACARLCHAAQIKMVLTNLENYLWKFVWRFVLNRWNWSNSNA